MKTTKFGIILLLFAVFTSAVGVPPAAHAQTYFLQSQSSAPYPFDPYDGAEPVVTLDASRQIYQVQDNTNDWEMLTTAKELDAMSTSSTMTMSADSIDPNGTNSGSGGTYTNNFQPLVFGSNDFVIQVLQIDSTNQLAYLQLSNTTPDEHYQLLSTNILSSNGLSWNLGEYIVGAPDTNITPFSIFNIGTNSQMFFRAHHANPVLAINGAQDAIRPNPATGNPGQIGSFRVQSYYPLSNDLTVFYSISGTAQSGVDYSNLSGVVTIPTASDPSNPYTNVYVYPTANNRMQGDKTVTLSILQTNDYLIDSTASSASITIFDSYTLIGVYPFQPIAYRPDGPPGTAAQTGIIQFSRADQQSQYPPITVNYAISGTASNGVDYTFLTGSLDFADGESTVYLDVNPLAESVLKGVQTVTVTLVPTNGYFVDTNNASQTVQIIDTSSKVGIRWIQDAIETNAVLGVGRSGIFEVDRSDDRGDYPAMTVNYQISGTASNGVDYQTLSGRVTFADGDLRTNIYINTIEQDLIEPNETVVLTLVPNTNAYYIDTNNSSASLTIQTTAGFITVATNLNGPIGIDYYTRSNSLIVSYNEVSFGDPFNFAAIYTNSVVTNWSRIGFIGDEVYLVAPRMPVTALTNSAGFTNGDIFFGSSTGIGWLSAGTTRSNLNWCILTNAVATNALLLRGGICADQTGTFSNHLIAVTSLGGPSSDLKGVWSVDAHANPTLLAQIDTTHLEGVTTLTNDVQRWGPWAGKIITGDEDEQNIYTIGTNGVTATFATTNMIAGGIAPEDFEVIPPDSTLYVTQFDDNSVMELPATYFRNNIGDLLITEAGEVRGVAMYIVHWDSRGSNFVTFPINLPGTVTHVEHTTFAPVQFSGH
jgi:hypothetical protein